MKHLSGILLLFIITSILKTHIAESATPVFVDAGNGTIVDTANNLTWLKDANCFGPQDWYGAMDLPNHLGNSQCGLSDYSKAGDWHLPNYSELRIFTDSGLRKDTLSSVGFTNVQPIYWSASTFIYNYCINGEWPCHHEKNAIYSDMVYNDRDFNFSIPAFYGHYVWPVRSGQFWTTDSLSLSAQLQFGTLPVGSTSPYREVLIYNGSEVDAKIFTIALAGDNASEFSVAPGGNNPCLSLSTSLAAKDTCTIQVGSTPTSNSYKTAHLTITSGSTSRDIPISAAAIATVYGSILDQSTGLPVTDASVTLNTGETAKVASDGSYNFGDLSANTYSITAAKAGYQTISGYSLVVTTTTSVKMDILLPKLGLLNITSTMLPSATAGNTYNSLIMVGGGTAPYAFSKVYGNLPDGLSLNTATGTISGTPIGSSSYTFAVGVTDKVGIYVEKEFTIDLVPTLSIATATLPRGSIESIYSATVLAIGGKPGYTYCITNGSLPDGLSFDVSGVLSGKPVIDGIFNVTITATDSTGRKVSKDFNINICQTLTIATNSLATSLINTPYNQIISATGGFGAYVWTIISGTLPIELKFNSATGIINGTPSSTGSYPLSIAVQDAVGRSTTANYVLNIAKPLTFITSSLPSTYKGDSYNTSLLKSGGVAPFKYSVTGTLPANLLFDSDTGSIIGSPTSSGLTNLMFTVTDSSYPTPQSASKNLSLRVWPSKSFTFSVTMTGNGSGTVNSDLGGLTCSSGTCSAEFPSTTINLYKAPSTISLFKEWTGDCVGNGACSFNLNANKSVTATFIAAPRVKVETNEYSTLQTAYDNPSTSSSSIIRLLRGNLAGTINAGRSINVVLEGGYNAEYNAISAETTIQGPVIIKNGSVIVKGINIK